MKREIVVLAIGVLLLMAINIPTAPTAEYIENVDGDEDVERVLPHGDNYCIAISTEKIGQISVVYTNTPTGDIDKSTDWYIYRDSVPVEVVRILLS